MLDESTTAEPGTRWGSLRLLNSYRLFVAFVVLLAFFLSAPGIELGRDDPRIFYGFAATYLVAGLVFAALLRQRHPGSAVQGYLHFYTDVVALAGIAFASGGVESGLGILLIVPVAASGLLLPMRAALLYAALATLFLLTCELVRHLEIGLRATAYPQAALVGGALFAVAIIAGVAARGRAQSAELARQRSRDVRHLANLNERIVQQMESGICVIAPDGRITLANTSAPALLGVQQDVTNHYLSEIAPGLQRAHDRWRKSPDRAIQPLHPSSHAEHEVQPQFTDLGDQGTLVALEDASFIQEQLRQLKLASLGRLSASIAHEIRNPLGAIQHSAQLLAESERLTAHDRRLIEIQLEHCRRVNDLVTDILQISRQRSGPPPVLELIDWLAEFVRQFPGEIGVAASRIGLEHEPRSVRVRFDGDRLRQVVANLCHNSLEHGTTDSGAPANVTLVQRRTRGGTIHLDVTDDGVPLGSDRVETLFEPFYTTSEHGTGLGLFLARELCQANGAQLRYAELEGGNCFRIQFQAPESDNP